TYTVTIDETLKNQSGKDFATISKGSVSIADTSVVKGPDGKTYVNVEVALRDAYGAPPLRVTYETENGTAIGGKDYTAAQGQVMVYPQLAPLGQWSVQTAVANAPPATYSQSISGSFMAYEIFENNRWKICIYDVRTGETFLLSDEIRHPTNNDRAPSILQTKDGILHVVWTSYNATNQASQVYYAKAPIDDLSRLTKSAFSQDPNTTDAISPVSSLSPVTGDGTNFAPQISSYVKTGGVEEIVIAWMCTTKDGRTEIYYVDSVDTLVQNLPEIKRVGNNNAKKTDVTVHGKNILWVEENALNGSTTIRLYNIDTQTTINLSAGLVGSSSAPTISGDFIAWVQTRSSSDTTTKIMYYQISTGQSFDIIYASTDWRSIYDRYYYEDFPTYEDFLDYFGLNTYTADVYRGGQAPCLDGEWLVWQEPRSTGGIFDIFAYNIKTKSIQNLTQYNADNDIAPQVVDNQVVWRSRFVESYGAEAQWQVRFVDLNVHGFIPQAISGSASVNYEPLLTKDMVVWRSVNSSTNRTSIQIASRAVAVSKATIQIEILANNPGIDNIGNKEFNVNLTLTGANGDLAELSKSTATVTVFDNYGIGGRLNYGTAPASYDTLPQDDGARHVNTSAIGFGGNSVQFLGDWTPGSWVCILVDATSQSALNLWVDWNGNGRFGDKASGAADPSEHVMLYYDKEGKQGDQTIQLKGGVNTLWMQVPTDAKVGQTHARFRVTSEAVAQDVNWFGIAPNGDVKDFAVQIAPPAGANANELVYVDRATNTLVIRGSAMENHITVERVGNTVNVTHNNDKDGRQQSFSIPSNTIREVKVDGYTGRDSVSVIGWANEVHDVQMNPFNAVVVSDTLKITVSNVSNIAYVGHSGQDRVEMWDSAGDDTVVLEPNKGSMKGPENSFVNTVQDVYRITAYSTRGGNDTLTMSGSTSVADQATSWMDSVTMWDVSSGGAIANRTYNNRGIGFADNVTVTAGAATNANSVTIIERIDASVHIVADPETTKLYRGAFVPDSPNLTFKNFNSVVVTAQDNTKLTASLTGSGGNDTLIASDTQAILSGTNFRIEVNHFVQCVIDAGAGSDSATFTSGKGGEHLSMLEDRKTFELYSQDNLDDALLKLIAFESIKFDAARNKCTANDTAANIKKNALIEIDLIGDWVQRNH
ncbi:MAG: GEVED domain-containing protein, partial [Planctomycetaceae bacterium]|nr:GEVED domain-containing protein [Planctomycetaceae bacterium]